jgi:hypothetical protein
MGGRGLIPDCGVFSATATQATAAGGAAAVGSVVNPNSSAYGCPVTTPVAGDYVTCNFSVRFSQDQSPNATETGAYEDLPPIPGGLRAEITATIQMAGSGAPGTAPEWGKLLRCCTYQETITATSVGAPTAAAVSQG